MRGPCRSMSCLVAAALLWASCPVGLGRPTATARETPATPPAAEPPKPEPPKPELPKPEPPKPESPPAPADKPDTAPAKPATPSDVSTRFDELLRKLEALRQEVEALRKAAEPPPKETPPKPLRTPPPGEWAGTLHWRSIGPAGMGGRITELAVYPADPSLYWVATASGGLLKTKNNGITFEHQFDHEATVSIGAVAVASTQPNVVWVGTGENNPRNSVSYGDGVYKSVDGGRTWKNMGLKQSYQIGRIVVHPTNPDIVYVGALGRLYGGNDERGLFKTTDGGATWSKALYVDDQTGVIDIALNPQDPETLLVATWQRRRDEFDSHRGEPPLPEGHDQYDPALKWGPGSGLYKTSDGGRSWKRLNDHPQSGLPTVPLGRMDVEYYARDPKIVLAIIDTQKIGMGTPLVQSYAGLAGADHPEGGAKLTAVTANGPAAAAELAVGDVVKAVQTVPPAGAAAERFEIATYAELVGQLRRRAAGQQLVLELVREGQPRTATLTLAKPPLSTLATASGAAFLGLNGENSDAGPRVTQVAAGSPAEKAGLKPGDILLSLDGQALPSYAYFAESLRKRRIGQRVTFNVLRDNQGSEHTAILGERAPDQAVQAGPLGLTGVLLGIGGEQAKNGLKISSVTDNRSAQKAGLEAGDVLVSVDGTAVSDPRALGEQLGRKVAGDQAKFQVERDVDGQTQSREVTVTLESPLANPLRPYAYMYAGQEPNIQDLQGPEGHEYGGVYKSIDGGETWQRVNSLNPRPMYFSQIRVDPTDDRQVYVLGVSLYRSPDGGQTFTNDGGRGIHADHHALWIDPRDGRHMLVGNDGGIAQTYDRMDHWDHLNHMAIAQFYHVSLDNRRPYWAYGGLQDNGSWGGPSRPRSSSGILNEDWQTVGGGDGFVCRNDPFDPQIVYSETQNGAIVRIDLRTGRQTAIRPTPQPRQRLRFNWNTPFILSSHNPGIFYCAGNYVFRSIKRGDELKVISPEITRTGRGSATAVAESPRDPEVLWVGTDDGQLWITRNGGRDWTSVADKLGLPGPRWIATIEPSHHEPGRCYVACDGHRSNDDEPYLLVTDDFGATWKSLRGNLPGGSTRCLREDPRNPNLLLVGTEFAAWASLDRGQSWVRINANLPTVAIHELAIHPTAGEVVAATHGRSLWVLDIHLLRQFTAEALQAPVWLFQPADVVRWHTEPARATGGGSRRYVADDPPRAARFLVSLNVPADKASLRIVDIRGATVRELPVRTEPGLQTVHWDLAAGPPRRVAAAAGRAGRTGRASRANVPGRTVEPGEYGVVLVVDGQEFRQTVRIEGDPQQPLVASEDDDEEEDDNAWEQESDRSE